MHLNITSFSKLGEKHSIYISCEGTETTANGTRRYRTITFYNQDMADDQVKSIIEDIKKATLKYPYKFQVTKHDGSITSVSIDDRSKISIYATAALDMYSSHTDKDWKIFTHEN